MTIAEVGFALADGTRLAITNPYFINGKSWPRRLESREALTAYFDPAEVAQYRREIGDAYARTLCGEVKSGTSPALKQLQDLIPQQ